MVSITETQLDVIKELINIGAGKGAEVLNSFLNSHIILTVPEVQVLTFKELEKQFLPDSETGRSLSSVEMKFLGPIEGRVELIFFSENASKLVELITGEHDLDHDFDEIKAATFSEVGNVLINAVIGTMSNELILELSFSIPEYFEGTKEELLSLLNTSKSAVVLVARTQFSINDTEIKGDIIIYFSLLSFDSFLQAINTYIGQFKK